MSSYHRQLHAICFDLPSLRQLFEAPLKQWIAEQIALKGYTAEELLADGKQRMHEMVNDHGQLQSKEDIEIFFALYIFPKFYGKNCQIYFPLKPSIDPRKTPINTLQKLKTSLKESDLTDFGVMSDDGYRQFQLKQYRGDTNSADLLQFIAKKLRHYGDNLGNVNMLVTLQSKGDIEGDFFGGIHRTLMSVGYPDTFDILISYNEADHTDVINTVFPRLSTTRIPSERTLA
jgi:hypothetical protein